MKKVNLNVAYLKILLNGKTEKYRNSSKMGIFKVSVIYLAFLVTIGSCLREYDFIIAGGGTAGLTVARRLSESGKFSVLVIESGGLPKNGSDISGIAGMFLGDREVTYLYDSLPQKHAGLRNGGIIKVLAGKMLGGTSSLNYMWWNRGAPKDYDNWANVTGDDSWKYSNMLKYFKKSETYAGEFHSKTQHGISGPIAVSQPKYAPGLRDYWLEAGRWLGYKIADPNGPQQVSFAPVEFSKLQGRRVSSWTGYISPVLKSLPNLTILTATNVTEIVLVDIIRIRRPFKSPITGEGKWPTIHGKSSISPRSTRPMLC